MARYIRKLAGASPDAIATAMKAVHLSKETICELKELSEVISKAPKQTEKKRTPEKDFIELIVPELERVMRNHKRNPRGYSVKPVQLTDLSLENASLEDLVAIHAEVFANEISLKAQLLFVRYQRGLIYKKAHELITDFEEFKEWIFSNFTISYGTATAYISVACLIANFPVLMKCSLSFEQLRRHGGRIRSYLEAHPGFGMNESCDVAFGATVIPIVVDPYSPTIADRAPQHPDFELFAAEDEKEEDFPSFGELTAANEEERE